MKACSRKRKSAGHDSVHKAPAQAAAAAVIVALDPVQGAGEADGEGADRLSSLPDAVLGEIVSLLTIREGVRTRILASRWRDLWLSAPLYLDCRDLTAISRKSVRPAVISRILSSHHGPGRCLYLDTCCTLNVPAHTVEAWLRSAALDNLEVLDFTVNPLEPPRWASIFRFSRTLRVANIGRCDLSDVSFQGLHFPMLKQLGLVRVTISECSLHTLIAGCTALECLLIDKTINGVRCLRINSLTITNVSILSRQHGHYVHLVLLQQVVIENAPSLLSLLLLDPQDKLDLSVVSAPKLETLGFIGETNYRGEFSTIVFGSTVIKGLHVDKLIAVVQSVKILALDMPNLCLDTVIELMRCFPCLEKLYIQSHESGPDNLWRHKHRSLIGCFGMRLKKIVLKPYWGSMSYVNFVTFFVLNANLLESVTLGIDDRNNNERFLAEQYIKLQIENGASKDVQLHFTTDTCVGRFYMVTDVRDYDLTDPFADI